MYGVTARLTSSCSTHMTNISRSKDNQAMKFGHENIARETFFLKSHT